MMEVTLQILIVEKSAMLSAGWTFPLLISTRSSAQLGTQIGKRHLSQNKNPVLQRLNAEIWKFYRRNTQSQEVFDWKMKIHRKLYSVLKSYNHNLDLVTSGSTNTGCASLYSDLDLNILPSDLQSQSLWSNSTESHKSLANRHLEEFRSHLNASIERDVHSFPMKIFHMAILRNARVPILRIIGTRTDTERRELIFDQKKGKYKLRERNIDVNVGKLDSVQDSFLLHHYARWDKRFPVLSLVISEWASKLGVKNSHRGRFGGFTLNLMIIHFLQCGVDPPILPCLQELYPKWFPDEPLSVAELQRFTDLPGYRKHKSLEPNNRKVSELLFEFFAYFSEFDFIERGISIRDGCDFQRTRSPIETTADRSEHFVISDPFDPEFNTALNVKALQNIEFIQQAFSEACDRLRSHNLKSFLMSENSSHRHRVTKNNML